MTLMVILIAEFCGKPSSDSCFGFNFNLLIFLNKIFVKNKKSLANVNVTRKAFLTPQILRGVPWLIAVAMGGLKTDCWKDEGHA